MYERRETDCHCQGSIRDPLTQAVMATAASSLFEPHSLAPNRIPRFREGVREIQALFKRILVQAFGVSEGIWIGTPVNLTRERESGELERRMAEIRHPVLWGKCDGWGSAGRSPDDGGGNAELPARRYARYRAFDE